MSGAVSHEFRLRLLAGAGSGILNLSEGTWGLLRCVERLALSYYGSSAPAAPFPSPIGSFGHCHNLNHRDGCQKFQPSVAVRA